MTPRTERNEARVVGEATMQAIAAFAAAELEHGNAVGGVLGITSADGVLAVIPVGSLDPAGREPMPADAVMPIASCSKTFLALVALQEREAGRLDFDAPISDHLPWFTPETIGGPITAHHCLTHTAGLPWGRAFTGEAVHNAAVTAREDGPFTVGPLAYSNDGFCLVGLALERITGMQIDRLLEERLLEPLGMAASAAALTPARRLRCAPGYVSAYDDRPAQATHPLVPAPWVNGTTADGSISASAADLCAFVRLLLRRGAGDAGPVVSPASFDALGAPHVRIPSDALGAFADDTSHGYALFSGTVDGASVSWHPGRLAGYSALYMLDAGAGLGVVWLANGESSADRIVRYALQAVRSERAGSTPPASLPPAATSASPLASARFVRDAGGGSAPGAHDGEGPDAHGELEFSIERGEAVLVAGPARLPLVPSTFVADGYLIDAPGWDRFVLRLERDAGGEVVELLHGPQRWVRDDLAPPPAASLPGEAAAFLGDYRSYNPFWPSVRIFPRRDELWALLESWGTEARLEPLGGGRYRVGPPPSGSRLEFDTVIEGKATRLVLDHQPYYRYDLP
jgi:CubicO group peptidase (beta-lactamase class C family)